jgi:RNA polymerase sigma-70 factor (ECF subfamily)
MADGTATLGSSFSTGYGGALSCDTGALEAQLAACCERGRAAWPDVELDPAALAAWLGARAPADGSPLAWLPGVDAASAFLACACAESLPRALHAFEATYLGKVDVYLRRLRPTPELVAETRQELLWKLFVGTAEKPPKIRQYQGKGSLEGWVRVTALRVALNLREARGADRAVHDSEEVARAIAPGPDPELAFMKASYQADFVAAFREAMASLPSKDRNLLRFAFVDRLTPARVGAIYGVHRTTAMRWIEAAQEEVVSRTRARLSARLHLTPSECDGIFALVQSRIQITLGSLLKTAS